MNILLTASVHVDIWHQRILSGKTKDRNFSTAPDKEGNLRVFVKEEYFMIIFLTSP